jgi:hypothetical protein
MTSEISVRAQLADVVMRARDEHDALLEMVKGSSSALALIEQINVLERLDDRRDRLVRELRREATEHLRRLDVGRSLRRVVLDALAEVGAPASARLVRDVAWGCFSYDVETQGLSSLRRDERASWQRDPGARPAFVVPALDENGLPLRGWMARSDWDLSRRIVPGDVGEDLLELRAIGVLLDRLQRDRSADTKKGPLDAAVARLATKLGIGGQLPLDADPGSIRDWRAGLRQAARARVEASQRQDEAIRRSVASALEEHSEAERLWGVARG